MTRLRLIGSMVTMLASGWLLIACGGRTEAPTPTPEPLPTNTPAPTSTPTPQPTNTPAPTATPDVTAGFVSFESAEAGVTLSYPGDWYTSDLFGFMIFASSQELLDAPEPGNEGAVALVVTGDTTEFNSADPVEVLANALEQFALADDAQIVEGPTVTRLNGQNAATAVISGVTDNGTPLSAWAAAIVRAERAVIFLAATPSNTEAIYRPVFEAMAASITVGEPTAPEVQLPEIEGFVLYGETIDSAVTADGPSAWGFVGLEGEVIHIIVEPLDSALDAVVDVLDESGASILEEGEVDRAFGKEEIRDLMLPSSGNFIIRIRGFADSTGNYRLTVAEAAAPVSVSEGSIQHGEIITGVINDETPATWSFTGSANDLVDITVTPLENEFDVVVDVQDAAGNSILSRGPLDDSYGIEYVRVLRLPEDGEYVIAISGYDGSTGTYELSLALANGGLPGSVVFADDTLEVDEAHAFPFYTFVANEVVTILVDPEPGLDVIVAVFRDGDDEPLQEVDRSTGFEELVFTASRSGNYYFEVSGFEGSTGAYEVILLGSTEVSFEVAYGDTIIGRFSEDADGFLEYQIRGEAGETLLLTATPEADIDIVVRLLDFDENVLLEVDDAFSGMVEEVQYTLAEDARLLIRISNYFGGKGEFTLSVDFR